MKPTRRAVLKLAIAVPVGGMTTAIAGQDPPSPTKEAEMQGTPYTLAMWRVKAGKSEEFLSAWKDLADIFSSLPRPPIEGTLLQSQTDSNLYYSFGPWRSEQDVAAMRTDSRAQAGLARLQTLCDEATPGAYQLVLHVTV